MVVAAASPLTRLRLGALLRAELFSLPPGERDLLWSEVLESDWQGDLAQLPPIVPTSRCFFAIRTRHMLERVRAAGLCDHTMLQRAAVRNRWADVLDCSNADHAAYFAIVDDAVWLLEDLIEARDIFKPTHSHVELAAEHGCFATVKLLYRHVPGERWSFVVMDEAAASGNLELVRWLHTHRQARCTTRAIDTAAANGHLQVTRWLATHRPEGCTVRAVIGAAVNGHHQVLCFLHQRFPQAFVCLPAHRFRTATDLNCLRVATKPARRAI
ncbi:hypothetical protein HK105_206776 [Polyrhizophydium stewartii]|uniref:Ankyrin repeat protein n=1 Tax=Polyrhizophydium stewartii TaxID=2732419 RepID=A0ABR4N2N7_9FUNG